MIAIGGTQRVAETEKITINMNVVDLGQVDLLVDEGFYTNRTDFIRTAIRNQINTHKEAVEQTVTRKHAIVGIMRYKAEDLEPYRERGERIAIKVVGLLVIADDVSADLAEATIESVRVQGVSRLPKHVLLRLTELDRIEH